MTWFPLRQLRSQVVMPRLNYPDLPLLAATLGLVGLGVVMVFNASYFFAQDRFGDPLFFISKHAVACAIGLGLCVLTSRIRLDLYERAAPVALLVSVALLVIVLVPGVGVVRGGARRWLDVWGFSFQPSELAKLAVIVFLARSITRKQERMQSFVYGLVPQLLVVSICSGLIVLQPDFGTTAILWLVLVLMLYVGGVRHVHLAVLGVMFGTAGAAAIISAPYRLLRLKAFLDPWEHSQDTAFQLVQSLIAFGSGGLAGVGLGASRQKMFFLPEAHNDFIFALIGEELGLSGALVVLSLFAVLGQRGFRIALRHPDPFGSLLAFGVSANLLLEALINVGVVLGLLPTKGLPLPFMSYGGSAMMGALAQVGILAALSRRTG